MKRYTILGILLFLALLGSAKEKKYRFPEMVKVNDSLYVDKFEISNADWWAYLNDIEKEFGKDSKEIREAYPDTTVMMNDHPMEYGAPYVLMYFSHIAYRNYPVVGITLEQVKNYCSWRQRKDPKKYKFKLPSKKEWLLYAKSGLRNYNPKLVFTNSSSLSSKGIQNLLVEGYFKKVNLEYTPLHIDCLKNKLGIYNIFGNVSEMLEEGIAFGGDFYLPIEDYTFDYFRIVDIPHAYIGFRCVAIVK